MLLVDLAQEVGHVYMATGADENIIADLSNILPPAGMPDYLAQEYIINRIKYIPHLCLGLFLRQHKLYVLILHFHS